MRYETCTSGAAIISSNGQPFVASNADAHRPQRAEPLVVCAPLPLPWFSFSLLLRLLGCWLFSPGISYSLRKCSLSASFLALSCCQLLSCRFPSSIFFFKAVPASRAVFRRCSSFLFAPWSPCQITSVTPGSLWTRSEAAGSDVV